MVLCRVVRLCMATPGYVVLCVAIYGSVGLCEARYGFSIITKVINDYFLCRIGRT